MAPSKLDERRQRLPLTSGVCDSCKQPNEFCNMRFLKRAFLRRQASPPASIVEITSSSDRSQKDLVRVHVYKNDLEVDLDNHLCMSRSSSSHSAKQDMPPFTSPARVASSGPYCPRRPTLQQLLDDQGSHPWTLLAFKNYALQNLCGENIDFLADAKNYERYYTATIDGAVEHRSLIAAWERLLQIYIMPNSAKEINISSAVRKPLLAINATANAPSPDALKPAVKKVYELIEDSVLLSFFNDVRPTSTSDEHIDLGVSRSAPPPASHVPERPPPVPLKSGSDRSVQSRASAPSSSSQNALSFMARPGSRPSNKGHHTSSSSAASGHISFDPALTDDNLSMVSSPTNTTRDGTPPHTPPVSEFGDRGKRSSSRGPVGEGSFSLRKMGVKLGFRRRSGSQLQNLPEAATSLRSQRDSEGDRDVFDEE